MKVLYVTTIGGTMTFFKEFIRELIKDGHTVDIACNDSISRVPEFFCELDCKIYSMQMTRSPIRKGNLDAIKQIKKLVNENQYDIVHCHTPVAAMCTRVACRGVRKCGTKVFYTAHGFHFYKGAPLKNWLLYYPIEKICACWTDILITINTEDYELAKKKLKAGRIEYVPGVGIDVSKFADAVVDRDSKRDEIGILRDATFILSVGELNCNKNHEVIIRALAEIDNQNVHYGIAGKGPLHEYLISLSKKLGVDEQVHLFGFRSDIQELYKVADICAFPSIREGFGLAAIEGMAAGLPLIISDNRGAKSYAVDNVNALICSIGNDVSAYADAINKLVNSSSMRKLMGEYNVECAKKFDVKLINERMRQIYGKCNTENYASNNTEI